MDPDLADNIALLIVSFMCAAFVAYLSHRYIGK